MLLFFRDEQHCCARPNHLANRRKMFSAILTVKTFPLPSYDKSIAETVSFKIFLTQTVADDLSAYQITFQV